MSENADKVKKKLEEVDGLISNFGSQSEQLESSQKQLRTASKALDEKTKETFDIINKLISDSKKWYEDSKEWYDKTDGEVGDLVFKFDDSLDAFKTIFDETKFGEVCKELSALGKLLEEYRNLKDDVLNMSTIIIDEVNKKIDEHQKQNKEFFEEKFADVMSAISSLKSNS